MQIYDEETHDVRELTFKEVRRVEFKDITSLKVATSTLHIVTISSMSGKHLSAWSPQSLQTTRDEPSMDSMVNSLRLLLGDSITCEDFKKEM